MTIFLFISSFLNSCKLNDTLTEITESISNISLNQNPPENESKDKVIKKTSSKKSVAEPRISDEDQIKTNQEDNKSINKEELEISDKLNNVELKNDLAFLSKDLKSKKEDNVGLKYPKTIGLLVPLTGDRSYVGQFVINSTRLYLNQNNVDIKIKVFDTMSTQDGAIKAFKSGLDEKVFLFIGPVFSDETEALKSTASKTDALIFSLSTDQKAASNNVIISGSNLFDEVLCIKKNLLNRKYKRIALIHGKNEYGQVLKEYFEKENRNLDITYLEINTNTDLDKTLREFSEFETREINLSKEINRIINADMDEMQKEDRISFLKGQTTFGELPFEAVIIGKEGSRLIEILSILAFYDINSSNTFIIGTSRWDDIEKSVENVLENTFFVSGFKLDKSEYNLKYSSIFSSKANNLNYVVNDVISLALQINYFQYPDRDIFGRKFLGQYSQGNISENRVLNRVIYLNQKNKRQIKTIDICPLESFD